MLENKSILTHNPFTLGAEGAPWLNHEWLFQITVGLIERLGTGPGLVGLRITVTVALTFLLLHFGRRAGLAPGAALAVACLCVAGCRMRLFVRPELVTLLLVPFGINLYLTRFSRPTAQTALAMAGILVIGINFHGAILVLPAILGALLLGEGLSFFTKNGFSFQMIASGVVIISAAIGGALLNPWGWRVLLAPFRLAHLVAQPYVPNPEWLSPGPSDVPALYVALVLAWLIVVIWERQPVRWILLGVISILALRYVRNVGLFFVVLPLAITPALARIKLLQVASRRASLVAIATVLSLAALMIDAPGFPLGLGFSASRYPIGASLFLEHTGLLNHPVYNDVRFGGWLIGRNYPPFRPLIDDRNEIHEELLKEMWEIDNASSPKRWQALLDSYGCQSALLRFHEPLTVSTPQGEDLGRRGFSALWFPQDRWALLYWDDVAMVLADRTKSDPETLSAFEYRWVRPDDGDHMVMMARDDPAIHAGLKAELHRKVNEDPGCLRAHLLLARLAEQ